MLIIVDGLDGAGKSYTIELLREKLNSIGLSSAVVSGIGSGQIGSYLRNKIVVQEYATESMKLVGFPLAILDAIKTAEELLKTNNIVIMDRGLGSYASYSVFDETTAPIFESMLKLIGLELDSFSNRGNIKLVEIYLKTDVKICMQNLNYRPKKEYTDKANLDEFNRIEHNFDIWFSVVEPKINRFIITNNSTVEDLEIQISSLVDNILV